MILGKTTFKSKKTVGIAHNNPKIMSERTAAENSQNSEEQSVVLCEFRRSTCHPKSKSCIQKDKMQHLFVGKK